MSHESDFGGRLCGEGKGPDSVLPSRPKQRGFSEETNLTNHTAFELLICRDHRDTTTKSSVFFHAARIWNLKVFGTRISPKVSGGIWALMSGINLARLANFYILPTVTERMKTLSGLLGGGFKYLFIFIPIWGNDPIWPIFSRWVGSTTNSFNAYLRLRRWTILFGFKKFWSLSDSAEKVEFFPKKSPKRTGGKTSEVVVFLFQVCWRLWVHVGFGNLLLSFQWGFFTEIWEQVVGLPSFEVIVSFTPPKTNECPLKRDDFNRKYIFQPLIFRGHVSFPGGRSFWGHCRKKGGY